MRAPRLNPLHAVHGALSDEFATELDDVVAARKAAIASGAAEEDNVVEQRRRRRLPSQAECRFPSWPELGSVKSGPKVTQIRSISAEVGSPKSNQN